MCRSGTYHKPLRATLGSALSVWAEAFLSAPSHVVNGRFPSNGISSSILWLIHRQPGQDKTQNGLTCTCYTTITTTRYHHSLSALLETWPSGLPPCKSYAEALQGPTRDSELAASTGCVPACLPHSVASEPECTTGRSPRPPACLQAKHAGASAGFSGPKNTEWRGL